MFQPMITSRKSPRRKRAISLLALWLMLLALLPVAAFAGSPKSALAQSQSYHMDQYNSDITVNKDGSFDIVETLAYVYDSGSFHRGTRTWDLSRIDDVTNIQVVDVTDGQQTPYQQTSYDPDDSTSGVPGTFGTTTEGGQFKVRWVYDRTSEPKTFKLSYHVPNGLKTYSDHYELDWYAVPPDWGSPINQTRTTVTFPAEDGIDVNQISGITSIPSAEINKDANTVTWTASTGLDQGLEIGVPLEKGAIQATEPSWQAGIDAQNNYNNGARHVVDAILLVLTVLLTIGGVMWGIMRWYTKGRDKPVKLFSDYVTEPPSDLPPGLVGTLLDEHADVRDVIATVADQGAKGNLTIQETQSGGIAGLFSQKDFQYAQQNSKVTYKFEEMVLSAIFKHGNPVKLSELKNSFYSDLGPIYDEMYKSLVALKYFPENPQAVRSRNVGGGVLFLVLAFITGFLALMFSDKISYLLIGIPFAIGVTGIVRLFTAGAMPRKTDFGAEEAAKWHAFSKYLEEIQRYTNVQAAADKFQKYLPYAVALGVERQLINQFNSVPSAMPQWYMPYGYGPFIYGNPVGTATAAGTAGGGERGMPSMNPADAMQGMSNSLASAMQGMSDSFTSMVNSAANALTSQPQSSSSGGFGGGGWGGGGGGFGGGGGGGGGGGAD